MFLIGEFCVNINSIWTFRKLCNLFPSQMKSQNVKDIIAEARLYTPSDLHFPSENHIRTNKQYSIPTLHKIHQWNRNGNRAILCKSSWTYILIWELQYWGKCKQTKKQRAKCLEPQRPILYLRALGCHIEIQMIYVWDICAGRRVRCSVNY